MEGANEGRIGDWSEVVTRYPYGNVGMDHLLSMEKEETKRELTTLKKGQKEKFAFTKRIKGFA